MQMLIKSCDVSNVMKPFPVARLWAIAVTEEFYTQGDMEKEKGLDILPMFDRQKADLAKAQASPLPSTMHSSSESPCHDIRPWYTWYTWYTYGDPRVIPLQPAPRTPNIRLWGAPQMRPIILMVSGDWIFTCFP